jgi:cell division septum initiation protein DivIVA
VAETGALPLLNEVRTMPSFRVAFRGYDPREVDRYAFDVEAELDASAMAQRDLTANVRSLTDQLGRAHEELLTLRRRPSVDDAVSFRHLGPRVEQILVEAHAEADAIRRSATENAAWLKETADAQVQAAAAEHARLVAGFEERERWIRVEEERLTVRLRTRQEAIARAEAYRDRVRTEAEELLAAAQEQHDRLIDSAMAHSAQTRTKAFELAAEIRGQAEQDAAAVLAEAAQNAAAVLAEAEETADKRAGNSPGRRSAKRANAKRGKPREAGATTPGR